VNETSGSVGAAAVVLTTTGGTLPLTGTSQTGVTPIGAGLLPLISQTQTAGVSSQVGTTSSPGVRAGGVSASQQAGTLANTGQRRTGDESLAILFGLVLASFGVLASRPRAILRRFFR
jgi:hypothetical protein